LLVGRVEGDPQSRRREQYESYFRKVYDYLIRSTNLIIGLSVYSKVRRPPHFRRDVKSDYHIFQPKSDARFFMLRCKKGGQFISSHEIFRIDICEYFRKLSKVTLRII